MPSVRRRIEFLVRNQHTVCALDVEMSAPVSYDTPADAGDLTEYRTLAASAVVSLVLGVLSAAALLDFWILKAIPLAGLLAGASALWRIRSRPAEFSGRKAALAGLTLSTVLLVAGSALAVYRQVTKVPAGYEPVAYVQLKSPLGDAVIPDEARALDGKRIFIEGFMYPTDHDRGITRFVLCRDNGDCCFGGSPPLSERILVELQDPLQTVFTGGLRHVAGTFHVTGALTVDAKKDVLYSLEADYIK